MRERGKKREKGVGELGRKRGAVFLCLLLATFTKTDFINYVSCTYNIRVRVCLAIATTVGTQWMGAKSRAGYS